MLHKLKIFDDTLNKLDEINKASFVYSDFKKVNSDLETALFELKSEIYTIKNNKFSEDNMNIINNIWTKINKLEQKILPKANLLNSFKNTNP